VALLSRRILRLASALQLRLAALMFDKHPHPAA
jgi:hypothetical protein